MNVQDTMSRLTYCRIEWLVLVLPIIIGIIIFFTGGIFGFQTGLIIGLIVGLLLGVVLWIKTPMPASERHFEDCAPGMLPRQGSGAEFM